MSDLICSPSNEFEQDFSMIYSTDYYGLQYVIL